MEALSNLRLQLQLIEMQGTKFPGAEARTNEVTAISLVKSPRGISHYNSKDLKPTNLNSNQRYVTMGTFLGRKLVNVQKVVVNCGIHCDGAVVEGGIYT